MFRKNCIFFSIHCNPSPARRRKNYVYKRFQCTVTPVGWMLSVQPIAAQANIMKILGKNTIFLNTLYVQLFTYYFLPASLKWWIIFMLYMQVWQIEKGSDGPKMIVRKTWDQSEIAWIMCSNITSCRLCTMYIDSKSNYIACWCIYLKRTLLYQNSITDRANTLYLDIGEVCQGVVGFVHPPLDTGILQAGPSIWLPSRQLYF